MAASVDYVTESAFKNLPRLKAERDAAIQAYREGLIQARDDESYSVGEIANQIETTVRGARKLIDVARRQSGAQAHD